MQTVKDSTPWGNLPKKKQLGESAEQNAEQNGHVEVLCQKK